MTEILKEQAEKADQIAIAERRARLRGKEFQDQSIAQTSISSTREEVDLGAMTDFNSLHTPIKIREETTAPSLDQVRTCMRSRITRDGV